jgi:hypothetical protein
MRHKVVYYQQGMFGGWPANGGVWSWGNEILVCFHLGYYKEYSDTHCIDRDRPITIALARSLDGGKTWAMEQNLSINRLNIAEPMPLPKDGINFGHPDFALKIGKSSVNIVNHTFMVSYDRGHTWEGPYELPKFTGEMTARTDYIVEGPKSCMLLLSQNMKGIDCIYYSDRAFAARTDDGGITWRLLGYMTDDPARSVMPSTVRLVDGTLVTALRRRKDIVLVNQEEAKHMQTGGHKPLCKQENWIEIRNSCDRGQTWEFLARGAETDPLGRNGNPPAMVVLPDGRLVLAYGYRGNSPAIKARISEDGGQTWGEEIILRDDARMHDIGYPRMVVRPDGKVVTIYYYTTTEMPEQHIEATIWQP